LVLSDGKRLRSHVLGLRLTDSSTGRSWWIAQVKDTVGEIVPPNQVWYRDAFEGLAADVRCVAGRGGFEADVVLRENPELPPDFTPEHTLLEVITEFLDPPEVVVRPVPLDPATGLVDEDPDFGTMIMTRGKVFVIPTDGRAAEALDPGPVVRKQWQKTGERTLLIEAIPLLTLRPLLAALPVRKLTSDRPAELPVLSPAFASKTRTGPLQLASQTRSDTGVVIDWTTVVASPDPYTFTNGETYLVPGPVTLSGACANDRIMTIF
jgi:hypothetical protein